LPAFAQGAKAFDAAHAGGVQARPLTPPGAPSFDVASSRLPAFAQGAKAFDAAHAGGMRLASSHAGVPAGSAPACRKNC